MSVHGQLRIVCDHCGASVVVSTPFIVEASQILGRRNWVFHDITPHGYELQYCNDACRELGLEALGETSDEKDDRNKVDQNC